MQSSLDFSGSSRSGPFLSRPASPTHTNPLSSQPAPSQAAHDSTWQQMTRLFGQSEATDHKPQYIYNFQHVL